jgi:succinate dehydrogenase/fumarate reductase flavoprotein subunit
MKRLTYDYDVIVIGAGIAGMVSAVTVNSLGKQNPDSLADTGFCTLP